MPSLLEEIKISNVRGRGGAGFPMGLKLQFCRNVENDTKFIICNADEGDAGAFSDRYLLEHRPHSVLFGMLMAGFLTGAKTGVLYIRAEYPAAIEQTAQAISEFEQLSLTTDFSFKIIKGAGAYICGEETALLESIEGKKGQPRFKPPFPANFGLYGKPTTINNTETFASVPVILEKGGQWFLDVGNVLYACF